MSVYLIKYYRNNMCVSQFAGDDETVSNMLFHMNCVSQFPLDITVTKTDSQNREYCLRFMHGGVYWEEIPLNSPHKSKENGSIHMKMPGTLGGAKIL